ncbi:MAG: sporulation protein YqfD, partial [Acetivibrio sp.]
TNMPSLYQKKSIPVHLVSKRDGIISSIVTRTGHPLVKMGDEVKTDDILISGVVDIIGDNDLLLRKHPCIADGEIILKTEYKYENNRNFSYLEKKYTKREQQGFAIQIKEKRLEIFPPSFTRKKWKNISTLVEKKQYNQLSFDKIKKFEYENKPKKYTMEEAQNYLNIKFKRYIKKITEKGVIIQENNVKIDKIGEKLQAKGTLTVLEPVKSYRKILDSEWRDTEGNEYSRSKS